MSLIKFDPKYFKVPQEWTELEDQTKHLTCDCAKKIIRMLYQGKDGEIKSNYLDKFPQFGGLYYLCDKTLIDLESCLVKSFESKFQKEIELSIKQLDTIKQNVFDPCSPFPNKISVLLQGKQGEKVSLKLNERLTIDIQGVLDKNGKPYQGQLVVQYDQCQSDKSPDNMKKFPKPITDSGDTLFSLCMNGFKTVDAMGNLLFSKYPITCIQKIPPDTKNKDKYSIYLVDPITNKWKSQTIQHKFNKEENTFTYSVPPVTPGQISQQIRAETYKLYQENDKLDARVKIQSQQQYKLIKEQIDIKMKQNQPIYPSRSQQYYTKEEVPLLDQYRESRKINSGPKTYFPQSLKQFVFSHHICKNLQKQKQSQLHQSVLMKNYNPKLIIQQINFKDQYCKRFYSIPKDFLIKEIQKQFDVFAYHEQILSDIVDQYNQEIQLQKISYKNYIDGLTNYYRPIDEKKCSDIDIATLKLYKIQLQKRQMQDEFTFRTIHITLINYAYWLKQFIIEQFSRRTQNNPAKKKILSQNDLKDLIKDYQVKQTSSFPESKNQSKNQNSFFLSYLSKLKRPLEANRPRIKPILYQRDVLQLYDNYRQQINMLIQIVDKCVLQLFNWLKTANDINNPLYSDYTKLIKSISQQNQKKRSLNQENYKKMIQNDYANSIILELKNFEDNLLQIEEKKELNIFIKKRLDFQLINFDIDIQSTKDLNLQYMNKDFQQKKKRIHQNLTKLLNSQDIIKRNLRGGGGKSIYKGVKYSQALIQEMGKKLGRTYVNSDQFYSVLTEFFDKASKQKITDLETNATNFNPPIIQTFNFQFSNLKKFISQSIDIPKSLEEKKKFMQEKITQLNQQNMSMELKNVYMKIIEQKYEINKNIGDNIDNDNKKVKVQKQAQLIQLDQKLQILKTSVSDLENTRDTIKQKDPSKSSKKQNKQIFLKKLQISDTNFKQMCLQIEIKARDDIELSQSVSVTKKTVQQTTAEMNSFMNSSSDLLKKIFQTTQASQRLPLVQQFNKRYRPFITKFIEK